MKYRHMGSGEIVDATRLEGPMLIQTKDGEGCAEAGQWFIERPGEWPVICNNDTFIQAFEATP